MNDGLLDMFTDWTTESHAVLADLGYEGENTRLTSRSGPSTAAHRPPSNARSTRCTLRPERWPSAGTHCSRPRLRHEAR
jgi:hypothetical protein